MCHVRQGTGQFCYLCTHAEKGLCWARWPALATSGLWEFFWNCGTFSPSRCLVQKYISGFQAKNETVCFAFVSPETWRAALSRQHRQRGRRSSGPGKQLPTSSSGPGPLCVVGCPRILVFVIWNTVTHCITETGIPAKVIKTHCTQNFSPITNMVFSVVSWKIEIHTHV